MIKIGMRAIVVYVLVWYIFFPLDDFTIRHNFYELIVLSHTSIDCVHFVVLTFATLLSYQQRHFYLESRKCYADSANSKSSNTMYFD